MKLPEDHMGHDFKLLKNTIYTVYLICKKCKIKVYSNDDNNNIFHCYSDTNGWMKLITCDEMIIKNIIE